MLKTETTTLRAKFIELIIGETPSIRLHKLLQRPDGGQKPFSISVPIRDERLLARVEEELKRGDEIEVEIETRWDEVGIPKALLNFYKVSVPSSLTLTAAESV